MKIPQCRAAYMLLFRPRAFKRLADEHVEHLNRLQRQTDKAGRGGAAQSEPSAMGEATDRVRHALLTALALMLAVVVVGWGSGALYGSLVGPASQRMLTGLQYLGVGILLWATLGKEGWAIQTLKGRTLPEATNEWIYRALYLAGSYFLIVSASVPVSMD